MNLSLFRRSASVRHGTPHTDVTHVPVNVTPDLREAGPISAGQDPNAPMDFDLTGAHALKDYIDATLQVNPAMPASRALLILRGWLGDIEAGRVPPPHERQNIRHAIDSLSEHFTGYREGARRTHDVIVAGVAP